MEEIAAASGIAPATIEYSCLKNAGATPVAGAKRSESVSTRPLSTSSAGPPPLPGVPAATGPKAIGKAKMLYAFEGRSSDELSSKPGDVITIFEKKSDGWWVGELNGKRGVFPGNYSEELPGGI